MKIEQHVGRQIRERREGLGLTQDELASRLDTYLGYTWSRQAVSAAEKGGRAFAVTELVALAAALETTPGDLITPPLTDAVVDLPGGQFTLTSPGDHAVLDANKFTKDLATLAYGARELEEAMGDLAGGLGALAEVAARAQQQEEKE